MTLGREDLITGKVPHPQALPFNRLSGYIATTPHSKVLKVVVFISGQRFKGYVKLYEIQKLADKQIGKLTIHKAFPKR